MMAEPVSVVTVWSAARASGSKPSTARAIAASV